MSLRSIKLAGKQMLLDLPGPLSNVVVSLACAARVASPTFRAYHRLGRPTRVLSGPFVGMNYVPIAVGSAWLAKIVGTYERELHPHLDRLKGEPCDVVVDVGSAEGYFAVGLTRMLDAPRAYCFDTDPWAGRVLARIAGINSLNDRMVPGGFCRPADLEAVLAPARSPLVISDCEGGELDLLDPLAVPELRRARIVVEIHDFDGATRIGQAIRGRFDPTHDIVDVPIEPRTISDFPSGIGSAMTDEEKLCAMDEWRSVAPGWLVLRPRS